MFTSELLLILQNPMCAFHRTVRLEGRPGECAVAYLSTSWIVDRYEIKRLCQWQRLECMVDGIFVDDLESPLWKVEQALNASGHPNSIGLITIVTAECPLVQSTQPMYHYHSPISGDCEPAFQLDLPMHLRYGAQGMHHIAPSPVLSLLSAVILCLLYLTITIIRKGISKNKKCSA